MRIRFAFLVALFAFFGTCVSAAAENLTEEAWLQNQGNQFIQALGLYDDEERFMRLRTLIDTTFDMQSMAKRVVGSRWTSLDADMQGRLVNAFKSYVIYVYAAKPINFGTIDFNVKDAVDIGNYNRESRVSASLTLQTQTGVQEGMQPMTLPVSFVVMLKGGSFRIVDVSLNGLSLISFVRGVFYREMQQNKNNIYVTLHALEKTAYNAAQGNYQTPDVLNEIIRENPYEER